MSIRHIPSPSDKYIKALEKELAEARQEVERLTADLALASKCWNVDIADLQAERDLSRELAEALREVNDLIFWKDEDRNDGEPSVYPMDIDFGTLRTTLATVLSRYEASQKQQTK